MKKTQLKQLIKPLVKECIHEVLLEEGLLTEVVAQVTAGMSRQQLVEAAPAPRQTEEAFNGVDLFEGTEPIRQSGNINEAHRPSVLGDDPTDAGVDISSILGGSSQIWKQMNK